MKEQEIKKINQMKLFKIAKFNNSKRGSELIERQLAILRRIKEICIPIVSGGYGETGVGENILYA